MFTQLRRTIRILLTCLPLLSFAGQADYDQELSAIIDKHISAHGGAQKLAAIQAIQLSGQFTGFSVTNEFTTISTAEGHFFSDYTLGKHGIREGFDGTDYWTIDPWQGFDFARKINKIEQHVIMQKADIVTPFFGWQKKGYLVDLSGREWLDGAEMHVITLKRPGMPAEKWYLDANTFLVYKYNAQWVDFAVSVQAETIFDDYREVHGVLMPFYVERTFSTRHTVTEVEHVIINPDYNPAVFAMPLPKAMEPLLQLCRNWAVVISMPSRSGQWITTDSITTRFTIPASGRVQAVMAYDVAFPVHATYTLSYNKRTDKYQMILYQEMFSTTELFSGTMQDGMLLLYPESSNESDGSRPLVRYSLNFSSQDSFSIHRERSTDGGENWNILEKIAFSGIE